MNHKSMRWLAMLALFATMTLHAVDHTKEARAEWMGGFVKMEAADKSAPDNAVAALDLYKQSLAVFEEVRRKYPQWNPTLLNYRINYCQQKIQELNAKLETQANSLSPQELVQLTNRQARELQSLENARKELNDRVTLLTESLRRAREEAAKSSGMETTTAALAAAKDSLERRVGELELRLRDSENKLKQASRKGTDADKLQRELEKCRHRLEELQSECDKVNESNATLRRQLEAAGQQQERLRRRNEDTSTALKVANALAEARKNDNIQLQNNLKSAGERSEAKDRSIAERDAEIARLKRSLELQERTNAELKALRAGDAELIEELRKGSETASASRLEVKRLEGELETARGQLKRVTGELATRGDELEKVRKAMEQSRVAALSTNEKNLEQAAEIARLRKQRELAEAQNIKLTAQLQEAKIIIGKAKDDSKGQQQRLAEISERDKTLTALEERLKNQVEISRRQEEQLATQSDSLKQKERACLDAAAKLKLAEQEAARLRAENETLTKERDKAVKLQDAANRADALQKELQEKDKSLAALRRTRDKNDTLVRQLAEARASNTALERKWNTANEQVRELERQLKAAQAATATKGTELTDSITHLSEQSRTRTTELNSLEAKYQELAKQLKDAKDEVERQREALNRQASGAEAAVRKSGDDFKKLQAELETLRAQYAKLDANNKALTQDNARLTNTVSALNGETTHLKNKAEAATGMAKNLSDADAKVKSLEAELSALRLKSANLLKLAGENADTLQQRLNESEAAFAAILKTGQTPQEEFWAKRIRELNARLDKESKRRIALEEALLNMEDKVRTAAPAAPATAPTPAQAVEARISRERERQSMLKGFLRQGTDAERQGKIEAARHNYRKALELDPDNCLALQRLGLIAAGVGNDIESVRFLRQAFKFDPDDMDTLVALGFAQARLGKSNWAVAYLGRAVALQPENADAVRAYGSALFSLGWTQAAELELRKASELKPSDPEAPFNLAVLMATAKPPRLAEAAKWYRQAVKNGAERDPGLDQILK